MENASPKKIAIGSKAQSARAQSLIIAAALVISLTLHLLVLIFAIPSLTQWMLARDYGEEAFAQKSLEKLITQRRNFSFTVVETPESARRATAPEEAEHRSDKNAAAQNPYAPPNLPLGKPFANGSLSDADAPPSPAAIPGQAQNSKSSEDMRDGASSDETTATKNPTEGRPVLANGASNFRREFLTGGPYFLPEQSGGISTEAGMDNTRSRAPDLGGFSLNTYEWDFAPYMLWLKSHVQRNIYPPPAFTYMGMISGRTVLQFRISRDGKFLGMELIGYDGHRSLMETSLRAVQLSAPFRVLPQDFPKDFLEVTAHFEYTVRK
ncbi:MAG: hypothetical protein ACREOI_09520 [bacterium]